MTAASSEFQAAATSPRLGRVHTIRIPEPLWTTLAVQAAYEMRRDGASEIVREIVDVHVRAVLSEAGVRVGRVVTDEDATRYAELMGITLS